MNLVINNQTKMETKPSRLLNSGRNPNCSDWRSKSQIYSQNSTKLSEKKTFKNFFLHHVPLQALQNTKQRQNLCKEMYERKRIAGLQFVTVYFDAYALKAWFILRDKMLKIAKKAFFKSL